MYINLFSSIFLQYHIKELKTVPLIRKMLESVLIFNSGMQLTNELIVKFQEKEKCEREILKIVLLAFVAFIGCQSETE